MATTRKSTWYGETFFISFFTPSTNLFHSDFSYHHGLPPNNFIFLTLKSLLTYSSHFHFPSFFSSHSLTSILLFLAICYSLSLNDGIIYRYICSNKALSVLTFLYVTLGICVCILFNYISFLLPFMSFSYIFTCILKRIFYISILICSHN